MTNGDNKAVQQTTYRFTGAIGKYVGGIHTTIPMVVRAVEFLADAAGTWPNEYRVHVYATIGHNEKGAQHIEFRMTYDEALMANIIEKAEVTR